ncbi:Tim18p KNAG_0G03070 [Huiozyma naganishii CBS 8797]|uniref:Succinate dehydrogenase [ubiquinone] cytochrome b small subunit n=1 Tax=Huiozyma naganishii (strain ATCC MYA-139 / BCRC 22969 / CBS 8797 / KCTC 17520 / NBRC 10181 / NCYC 3082 / Yp74L-3) TaxID=1071383 RepID=J7S859_HUIN7|nr:hypothetical protein KNAG_0G03070 [Kazachstania naganishii CBS 8797]CCK71364.1 hypothetical protein KNAG_0G03070 [Kazachstania naganishii CBS 8797]
MFGLKCALSRSCLASNSSSSLWRAASIRRTYILPMAKKHSSTKEAPAVESTEPQAVVGKLKPPKSPLNEYQAAYQRIISYTLIPVTIIPFYTAYAGIALYPTLDFAISSLFIAYCHYGFKSLILEYLPTAKFPRTHRFSTWGLYLASLLSMCGVYQLETENNGVFDLIARLWNYDERNLYVFGKN